jgi:hypothetical protein
VTIPLGTAAIPLIHAAYAGVTKREVPSPIIATSLALTTASLFVILNGGGQKESRLIVESSGCQMTADGA